jgi:histidine ammonia-lyase
MANNLTAHESATGLALLNGTQFMTAFGVWCSWHAQRLLVLADHIAALSLDAFDGRIEPFDAAVHAIRPQARLKIESRGFLIWKHLE